MTTEPFWSSALRVLNRVAPATAREYANTERKAWDLSKSGSTCAVGELWDLHGANSYKAMPDEIYAAGGEFTFYILSGRYDKAFNLWTILYHVRKNVYPLPQ